MVVTSGATIGLGMLSSKFVSRGDEVQLYKNKSVSPTSPIWYSSPKHIDSEIPALATGTRRLLCSLFSEVLFEDVFSEIGIPILRSLLSKLKAFICEENK